MAPKKKPSMLTSQRQKLAAQRAKRAASQAKARGGMTNLKKPTMQKLVRKAAQKRKAASGRPLVRKSELAKAAKPSIKEGAKKLRVPGDSGQVRAAQARGKAEVRKAVARRGAKAASQQMAAKLSRAKLGRNLKSLGRGGLTTAGLTAANAIQDRLLSPQALAKKRANSITPLGMKDMPKAVRDAISKPKPKPKKAEQQGPAAPTTTQSSFNKKSFNDASRTARKSGAKTFTCRGKKYTPEMK